MEPEKSEIEAEPYADGEIPSLDAPVPGWLKFNYVLWIIFGIVWLFLFWSGSTVPFFDRGYWYELQKAANTTFPSINADTLPPPAPITPQTSSDL